jgi:hypothetical protein
MARRGRDVVGEAEGWIRVMLAGPDEEEWMDGLQGLEAGRERKKRVAIIASNSC